MNNQNKEHHDINDVCHRLDKLVHLTAHILEVSNALLLAVNPQHDLLASIDKHVASIDEKTPTPPDIGVDGGKIATTQKE